MDKEAQGENSSSQNVKLSLLAVRRGAKGNKVYLYFSDSSSFFVTPGMADRHSLQEGNLFSVEEKESLADESLYIYAKRKALEYLGNREHSEGQLRNKLIRSEYPENIIQKVIEDLIAEGSLSNERFMESWVSSRLRKHPEGMAALYAGLLNSGIPSASARAFLDGIREEVDWDNILMQAGDKIVRKSGMTADKLIRALKRRGFEDSMIIRYVTGRFTE